MSHPSNEKLTIFARCMPLSSPARLNYEILPRQSIGNRPQGQRKMCHIDLKYTDI